ncbi:MDIS1-interacting receptor like kinase 2-like [Rhododendron vialii]|uniref:MDIS1-interacting receptor like kinase 2-like n=1 Tax=Rhododendron vialii TaxID=182163 RepID=UPI00265DC09F|nr:MDIS1-interacting receptor like kinase 2-like [Rhododendron vialii]
MEELTPGGVNPGGYERGGRGGGAAVDLRIEFTSGSPNCGDSVPDGSYFLNGGSGLAPVIILYALLQKVIDTSKCIQQTDLSTNGFMTGEIFRQEVDPITCAHQQVHNIYTKIVAKRCRKANGILKEAVSINEFVDFTTVGKLLKLSLLNLSDNRISGQIPFEIGGLSNLASLDLSMNMLSGPILGQIGDISMTTHSPEGPLPDSKVFNSSPPEAFSHNKNLCGDSIQGLTLCNNSVSGGGGKENKGNSRLIIIAVSTSLGSLFLLLLLVGAIALHRKCNRRSHKEDGVKGENIFLIQNFCGRIVYGDIIRATENFDDAHCIGHGGSARVYKVNLSSGQVVAVKKLFMNEGSEIGEIKSFANEVATLTEIRHRNIVKLYGFYYHKKHTFLVCEYMERKMPGSWTGARE